MEAYGPATYGDHIADVYDERHGGRNPASELTKLDELAGDGPVLELGIGTGRVAIPLARRLAARGAQVHGMDASEPMVAHMRQRPGGDAIPVAIGDMRDVVAPADAYRLVYVVFNTFYALLDQDAQVDCFANVAKRLAPGGRFLIEAFVPDLARYDEHDQSTVATSIDVDAVELDVFRHDPVTQRVEGHHVHLGASGTRLLPLVLRYAFPSELDLMARLAGLTLESRDGGYAGELFTASSMSHVSVYRKGTT